MIDLALLAYLANHPDILPWVAPGRSHMDVSHHNLPGAVLFGDEAGAVLFRPVPKTAATYEMHYLFTEALRGKAALRLIRAGVTVMFTELGAAAMCGAVPREHRASRVMSRAIGAKPIGSHTDTFGRSCIIYMLERESWATLSAESSGASVQ